MIERHVVMSSEEYRMDEGRRKRSTGAVWEGLPNMKPLNWPRRQAFIASDSLAWWAVLKVLSDGDVTGGVTTDM